MIKEIDIQSALIRSTVGGNIARVELLPKSSAGEIISVEMYYAQGVNIGVRGFGGLESRTTWMMNDLVPPIFFDAYLIFSKLCYKFVSGSMPKNVDGSPREWSEQDLALVKSDMAKIHAIVAEVALHASRILRQDLRAIAMRFLPHMRVPVYNFMANDPSGRVAQLAISMPGSIIFSAGANLVDPTSFGNAFISSIGRGKDLSGSLSEAIEHWYFDGLIKARQGVGHFAQPMLNRLHIESSSHYCQTQTTLIERAMSMVSCHALNVPPPLSFEKEDIPVTPRANGKWFRVLKASSFTLFADDNGDYGHRFAFSEYLSKNFKQIKKKRRRDTTADLVERLYKIFSAERPLVSAADLIPMDYVLASGTANTYLENGNCDLTLSSIWPGTECGRVPA